MTCEIDDCVERAEYVLKFEDGTKYQLSRCYKHTRDLEGVIRDLIQEHGRWQLASW